MRMKTPVKFFIAATLSFILKCYCKENNLVVASYVFEFLFLFNWTNAITSYIIEKIKEDIK